MFDELQASGATLDYENLGRMLGVPMVPVEARNNRGIDALLDTVIDVYETATSACGTFISTWVPWSRRGCAGSTAT